MADFGRRQLLLGSLLGLLGACATRPDRLRLAAAASTASTLEALLAGLPVEIVAASSSTLARQIEAGAPFDLFLSADPAWIDRLIELGLALPEQRVALFGNRLSLAVRHGTPQPSTATAPPGRVALGDPAHVPLGRYSRQAFEALGWWSDLEGRTVTARDARATARLIELGEVDWGLVYASDAHGSERLDEVWRLPAELHRPIDYQLVALHPLNVSGQAVFAFLGSDEAARHFVDAGFEAGPVRDRPA